MGVYRFVFHEEQECSLQTILGSQGSFKINPTESFIGGNPEIRAYSGATLMQRKLAIETICKCTKSEDQVASRLHNVPPNLKELKAQLQQRNNIEASQGVRKIDARLRTTANIVGKNLKIFGAASSNGIAVKSAVNSQYNLQVCTFDESLGKKSYWTLRTLFRKFLIQLQKLFSDMFSWVYPKFKILIRAGTLARMTIHRKCVYNMIDDVIIMRNVQYSINYNNVQCKSFFINE
ncbi:hypothetical protein WN51_01598 [Melipona quadrifasciata]|uniref:Uncharacterized protein n=1 Tax=Melipona quadrifasciata TaxID=166423 RepID=A0A0M8ZUD1_9HYME|nr:hypothetical protein WN51_01598 [Melipona quadrifasciata]